MTIEPTARTGARHTRRAVTFGASVAAVLALGIGALTLVTDEVGAETSAVPITATATPRLPPSLPIPEAPPTDEYADVTVAAIGSIEIPAIGLVHELYAGIWLTVLDVGPGHWPGTAEPGGYGNSVIAGHRVTNTAPFRAIHELARGDEIIVTTVDGRFVYEVTGDEVVDPVEGMRIVDQEPGHALTIFACHPPGSAALRYVVYGELASETLEARRSSRTDDAHA